MVFYESNPAVIFMQKRSAVCIMQMNIVTYKILYVQNFP